jgi:putative peptidoglycan lipid II flippase
MFSSRIRMTTNRISQLLSRIKSSPIVRDTLITTFFATSGKGIGFLIPFFIAAWYGVDKNTDAFFFAYGLIIFLAMIFAPVMESILVPFIAEKRAKNNDIGQFVGRILGMSAIGILALSAIFLIVIKPLLMMVTKFSPDGLDLIYNILLESIPLVVLLVWTSILSGALNAYKIFVIPAISPAFRAVVTLLFIYVFKDNIGVHAIAWGYVIGELSRLGILFILLRRLKLFQLQISIGWEEQITDFFKTSSYQIIGMVVLGLAPIINKTMASWLGKGNVSILEYADRLYMIPLTFLTSGFMVTFLAHWSDRYQTGGETQLRKDVYRAGIIVGIISIILTILLFITKGYLIPLVYGYGKFPQELTSDVVMVFGYYLLGLAPYFLSQVYVRAFLTMKDTKVLLVIGILRSFGVFIISLGLMRIMGIAGIALATTIVTFGIFLILLFLFHRKKNGYG